MQLPSPFPDRPPRLFPVSCGIVQLCQLLIAQPFILFVISPIDGFRFPDLPHAQVKLRQIVPEPVAPVLSGQALILPVSFHRLIADPQQGIEIAHIRIDYRGHLLIHI